METYRFAGWEKDALEEKTRSGSSLPWIITPPGTQPEGNRIPVDNIAIVEGDECSYSWEGVRGEFSSPLLLNTAYRDPITMATAGACLLGIDPAPLSTFSPVPGRMTFSWKGKTAVVDDSNSGTCALTATQAIRFARQASGNKGPLTLVIGKEEGAICEGFPGEDILALIHSEYPDRVILVGPGYYEQIAVPLGEKIPLYCCDSLAEGEALALQEGVGGMVVLAVKTWR